MADEPPQKWFQWNAPKIFLKHTELSNLKKFQISQLLSDWEASEIYISLSYLYKFQTWEAYITLNIDIFVHIFVWERLE